ncbi:acyltransferase family protein [Amycolatopsis aidingensis]|uniref:acyltransferase family protein n=1 Tax=Amycolatopsis aidingensis TaxID=2842453 RepID=UPI001C0CD902|nr:acyltransferase family protein [Amycolatopsis aidingensis]
MSDGGRPAREPLVDLVRAVAITGVVLGHWLVTAAIPVGDGLPSGLRLDSPLRYLPELAPLSWLLQTLGLFFFAGGFGAAVSRARSRRRGERLPAWWAARVSRLLQAILLVLLAWAAVLGVLLPSGLGAGAAGTVVHLVTSPLWFLAVYVVLLACADIALALHRRLGLLAAAVPAGLALLVELATAAGAPAVLGQATVLLVWWTPWQLGVAAAGRGLPGPAAATALLALGVAGGALAVLVFGYPVSAVGGTGEARSNLAPPSPFALALALAQVGAVLLAAPLLRRFARAAGGLVGWVNTRALPIFLLHQSALTAVVLLGAVFGTLPGLHGVPTGGAWVLARLCWLPCFAAVLWLLLSTLGRVLPGRRGPAGQK